MDSFELLLVLRKLKYIWQINLANLIAFNHFPCMCRWNNVDNPLNKSFWTTTLTTKVIAWTPSWTPWPITFPWTQLVTTMVSLTSTTKLPKFPSIQSIQTSYTKHKKLESHKKNLIKERTITIITIFAWTATMHQL